MAARRRAVAPPVRYSVVEAADSRLARRRFHATAAEAHTGAFRVAIV
jgi:hypothetical protein